MDNLFSHAELPVSDRDGRAADLDPVIRSVTVPGQVAQAFAGFTDHTHLWWPMEDQSVFGEGSYVEFEDVLILETADDGRTAVWGSIDQWEPPLSFHAKWHPGTTALWSTGLRVAFRAIGDGTEIRLAHDGWDGAEDPSGTRAASAASWPAVLERFVRFMGGPVSGP